MSFSDERGQIIPGKDIPLPGNWPDEVTITVFFKEVDGKTHVEIIEEGVPTVMNVFAKMGWEQQFDKFETLLK